MSRKTAFAAVRRVVGPEVCPTMTRVVRAVQVELPALAPQDRRTVREALGELAEVTTTTHNLRHALAGLLVLHLESPEKCPSCEERLPEHGPRCHLGLLLQQ